MSARVLSPDAIEMREACAAFIDEEANELAAFADLYAEDKDDMLSEIADLRSRAMEMRAIELYDEDTDRPPPTKEHPAVLRARADEYWAASRSLESIASRPRDPRVKAALAHMLANLRVALGAAEMAAERATKTEAEATTHAEEEPA